MMTLQDKVALVTGASRGIGLAICLGLASQGAKVVVAARTEVDTSSVGTTFEKYASGTIHATVQMIQQRGGTAIGIRCDVTQVEDLRRLVERTLEHFGRLDVVVTNAGVDLLKYYDAQVVDLTQLVALATRAESAKTL
jgi:NAD(P)-dependent dehydrogenase (short-subunit alcohol dehydrogenase family)